jgi:hypothetical protein
VKGIVSWVWRAALGSTLILSALLIFGVIDHHERLGYVLMAIGFTAQLAADLVGDRFGKRL